MVVPDWLYNLLVKLGLTDSDKVKKRKKIAELEEKKRKLYQGLDHYIKKIQNLEVEIKVLRPQYESAHGPEKNILAAKIKPLLQELELMKEKDALVSQQIKDLTSIIHNKELLLVSNTNPDIIDVIEDSIDERTVLTGDLDYQKRVGAKLRSQVLYRDDDNENLSADESSEVDELSGKIDALFGDEKKSTKDELTSF